MKSHGGWGPSFWRTCLGPALVRSLSGEQPVRIHRTGSRAGLAGSGSGGIPPDYKHGSSSFIRKCLHRLFTIVAIFFVAMYCSVMLEEVARGIARTQTSKVPKRAQILISLIGTGQLEWPLLSQRRSKREEMRELFEPQWGVGASSSSSSSSSSSRFATTAVPQKPFMIGAQSAIQQQQLISTSSSLSSSSSITSSKASSSSSSSTARHLKSWHESEVKEQIPVVFFASHVPNEPRHPAMVVIEQARKLNNAVYLVGPNPALKHLQRLNVTIEPLAMYNETFDWVKTNLGVVRLDVVRFWFLRAFMRRHRFSRCLCLSVDVMLYANASQLVHLLFPDSKVVLPVRWPSMQPPPLPSQYVSTAVSAHTALWHIDALSDFLDLYMTIFKMGLFGGVPGSHQLMRKKEYHDMTILGWYTWSECWLNPKLDPPCMAEPVMGISGKLANRLRRTRYRPKFMVESFCQPRPCPNTSWSDEGLCVFDNNFSVGSPSRFFKFGPQDKCPQTKLYEHYHAWMGQTPRKNVQFLTVNFQGARRDYLKLEEWEPWKSWGSAVF